MDYELAKEPLHANRVNWKGDSASYFAKHQYVRLHFGKADHCDNPEGCVYPRRNRGRNIIIEAKRFEWALIKGRAYSRNKEDYMQLCASCHRKYDL